MPIFKSGVAVLMSDQYIMSGPAATALIGVSRIKLSDYQQHEKISKSLVAVSLIVVRIPMQQRWCARPKQYH
jgi:hypothetical protein